MTDPQPSEPRTTGANPDEGGTAARPGPTSTESTTSGRTTSGPTAAGPTSPAPAGPHSGTATARTPSGRSTRPPGNGSGGGFFALLRAALGAKPETSWRDTIEELIEETGDTEEATLAVHERQLFSNILQLKDRTAYDVMVPRADIFAVDVETPTPDLIRLLSDSAHSRMPVYRETLDDVVGLVHIKDVFVKLATGADFKLAEILRDVLIVAPSMPALDLLLEMRQGRSQMALVVDEFGGIDGLITIEDLVEEIVGEIQDEHDDQAAPKLVECADGSYLTEARLPIQDLEAVFGPVLETDDDDIDTVGGLVFSLAGRVPVRGEVLRDHNGLEFEVTEADPRRIKRLRIRRVAPAPAPDTRPAVG